MKDIAIAAVEWLWLVITWPFEKSVMTPPLSNKEEQAWWDAQW